MNHNNVIAKWLRILMYAAAASLANAVISLLPFVPNALTTWVSRGVMLAVIVCMFQLAPAHPRYQKAGILRAVVLGFGLIFPSLALVASILSIIAVYQEYNAHSELIAEKDAKLSRQWHSLFNWSIVSGLLVGFASTAAVVIMAMLGLDAAKISDIIVGLLGVPQMILDAVYLLYVKRMIGYFRAEEYSSDACSDGKA